LGRFGGAWGLGFRGLTKKVAAVFSFEYNYNFVSLNATTSPQPNENLNNICFKIFELLKNPPNSLIVRQLGGGVKLYLHAL
jgi:hypothetical protein